jgi:2-deoxy-D-gluconate 3-dehydrogenase
MKTIQQLFNFLGKTVIVTGGSMGIGYGIVLRFLEAGANVVISDIDEVGKQKAEDLVKQGHKVIFVKTDVSSEQEVKNLVAETLKQFGSLDILVNNAGIYPQKPVLEMDLELWEKIQAVNQRSVFLCSREAAKVMIEKGKGNIVNIASIDSLHPSMVGLAAYDTSKHGVWGFTKNFALEVAGKGIRVNAIAPGGITTEGVTKMMGGESEQTKAAIKQFAERVPLGRFGEPDDIAMAAVFCASDASAYMTGEILVIDGGVLLK